MSDQPVEKLIPFSYIAKGPTTRIKRDKLCTLIWKLTQLLMTFIWLQNLARSAENYAYIRRVLKGAKFVRNLRHLHKNFALTFLSLLSPLIFRRKV